MDFHIHEKEKIISYIPEFREYAIKASKSVIQQINYCPWCGKGLPKDLNDQFFDVTSKIMGRQISLKDLEALPEEFHSDEWWKKRNL